MTVGLWHCAWADGTPIYKSNAVYVEYLIAFMIKILKELLAKIWREHPIEKSTSIAKVKRPNSSGDFRAVEISPSITCCTAATQLKGKRYLLRGAPRLPLYGCTMPTNCSCKFRKTDDRRDAERRLFGAAETKRWYVGLDNRKGGGRRSAEE
jgi:hypothetical protein